MPCPVGQRAVDEDAEEHHEHHVCGEAHTLGEGAGDKGWCDDGELHLEEGVEGQRYGGRYLLVRLGADVAEHEELRRVADESRTGNVIAECQ